MSCEEISGVFKITGTVIGENGHQIIAASVLMTYSKQATDTSSTTYGHAISDSIGNFEFFTDEVDDINTMYLHVSRDNFLDITVQLVDISSRICPKEYYINWITMQQIYFP